LNATVLVAFERDLPDLALSTFVMLEVRVSSKVGGIPLSFGIPE
jgi:hypothetical protein